MKNYQLIEDNAGGLHLITFGADGNPDYYHWYNGLREQAMQDVAAIKNGADPVTGGWEGNCFDENSSDYCLTDYDGNTMTPAEWYERTWAEEQRRNGGWSDITA